MQKIVGVTKCFSVTPEVDLSAYASGYLFVELIEITGVSVNENGCTWLQKLLVKDTDAQDLALRFFFCHTDPGLNVNPGESLNFTETSKVISGVHDVLNTDYLAFGGESIAQTFGTAANPMKVVDGKLYLVVVAQGAATFTNADAIEFDIHFTPDSSIL